MSEIAAGSMSLEENALPQDAPPPAETPAPAVETPTEAAEPDPDGTIEASGGVKFVPLGAVVETRGKLKERTAELEATKAELAAAREQTKEIEQIRTAWQSVQPILQQARQQQPPPAAPAGPLSAQEAVDYAKDLDLYKADGTPDTERAQRLAARQESIAQRQTQAAIAPFQQQTAQQQSAVNLATVASWKDKAGAQVDPEILKQVWSQMPAEMTAQPNIAAVMYRVAIAESMLQGKYKGAPVPPPPAQITESLGGGTGARPEISSFERKFLETTDMKPKDYEEISGRFKPGQHNSLE